MAALLKLNEMRSLLKMRAFLMREGFIIKGWVKLDALREGWPGMCWDGFYC
jgi:hypothetical protein